MTGSDGRGPGAAAGAAGAEAGGGASSDALPAGLRASALWLDCSERLAAAAAHEVNNALNGAAMNLEVVRLRARPGADAGLVSTFAAAAAAEHEATVALVSALLALGRAPRPTGAADVEDVLARAATLFAPLLRHQGVTLRVGRPEGAAHTSAPARAVRLAVCSVLEAALEAAAAARAGGGGADRPAPDGADPGDPPGVLRCNLLVIDRPTLVVSPPPAGWSDETRAALAGVGVDSTLAPDGLRVAFPPA